MTKLNKLTYLTALLIVPCFIAAQENYDTDTFENFVADQEIQQSLNDAQETLCQIANMGTKDLANDGAYKATQTLTLCSQSTGGSGSSDGSAATAAVSAQSSTTASSATSGDNAVVAVAIDEFTIDSQFLIDGSQETKLWFADETPFDEQTNRQPKLLTYVKLKQTDGESEEKRFGDFVAQWQSFANGNRPEDFPEDSWARNECSDERIASGWSWCIDGTSLGEGTLIATGNAIKYRARGSGPDANLAAEFLSNDDVKGVYTRQTGWSDESLIDPSCDGSEDWWNCQSQEFRDSQVNVTGQFTFGRDAENKLFCSTLAGLYYVDWQQSNEDGTYPKTTPVTLNDDVRARLAQNGWSTTEACYSVDAATTIKNVWDYGVYNQDGSPYTLANPSFPIKAIVEVTENAGTENERIVKKRIHGYASYWGVHVDESYQNLVTDTTPFKRDDLSKNDLNVDNVYNVKPRSYRIERTDKVYSALNDLDGLSLQFYVGNDEWWSEEYKSLGFPAQTTFNNRIAFATNKATLVDYDNGSASNAFSHSMYGSHDGASTFIANLEGGKIDKTNLLKLLANDSGDPGKVMTFNVKLGAIPGTDYSYERIISPYLWLCTGSSITTTSAAVYGPDQFTLASGQACLQITGGMKVEADGTTITLTAGTGTNNDDKVYATYFDSTGLNLSIPGNYPFNLNDVYDINVTANGFDENEISLEFYFGRLIEKFAALTEQGNRDSSNNGLISQSLEAFINSSDSFTFLAQSHGLDLFTHDMKRFDKIKGTFEIADTPPMAVYADDVYVNESAGTADVTFKLTKVATSDTTIDYTIAGSSTASTDDYDLASSGTVTILTGAQQATLSVTITNDAVAESLDDEMLTLTLSNPVNASLGRTSTTVHIFDDDINRTAYNEYVAVFDADSATFVVEEGIKNDGYWQIVELATPFQFTVTDWLTKMKKTWNVGTEWERTEIRDIGAWSSDTETYYRIFPSAMQNPTSTEKGVGVQSEVRTIISASELPENLYCFERCPSTSLIKAHYDNAISQVSGGGNITSASPNPHIPAASPQLTEAITVTRKYDEGTENEWEEVQTYEAGHYFQGQTLANMATYTKNTDGLVDPDGSSLALTSDFSEFTRPGEAIRGSYFTTDWGRDETSWGIWTGQMVDAANLAKLECDKEQNGEYRDFNARYPNSNDTRYCQYKLWQSDSEVDSFYNVSLETNKNYEIFDEAGSKVVFDPRQTFNLVLPDDAAKFGDDAGKKFRLDFQGSHLGGIPGNVINKETGENLGEWVREWKDEYRWVQRFVIPDGTVLTSRTSDVTVKVKALRGEEWLLKRDDAIGSMPDLLDYSLDKLAKQEDLEFEIGPRPIYWWGCDSNQNGIANEWEDWTYDEASDTWTEGAQIDVCNDRETGEPTLFDENGDPIYYPYQPEYATDAQKAYFILENSFPSCVEQLEYQIADWRARNNERSDDDPGKLGDYTQDEGFMEWFSREERRCQTIGPVPDESTLINDGLPAVVDGKVVFDPTPTS